MLCRQKNEFGISDNSSTFIFLLFLHITLPYGGAWSPSDSSKPRSVGRNDMHHDIDHHECSMVREGRIRGPLGDRYVVRSNSAIYGRFIGHTWNVDPIDRRVIQLSNSGLLIRQSCLTRLWHFWGDLKKIEIWAKMSCEIWDPPIRRKLRCNVNQIEIHRFL